MKRGNTPLTAFRKILLLGVPLVSALLAVMLWLPGNGQSGYQEFVTSKFDLLREQRLEKRDEILQFFDEQYHTARSISEHPRIPSLFLRTVKAAAAGYPPPEIQALDPLWENLYVQEFGLFYDLMLVDPQGNIIYSIRREKDLGTNLQDQQYRGHQLQREFLQGGNDTTFVGFDYYPPSAERAAFFLVPMMINDTRAGSILLQVPLNQINRILSQRTGLGRTGEIYLVNEERHLLSSSRFISLDPDTTTLSIQTDARIKNPEKKESRSILTDYRGVRVLSSFELVSFLGTDLTLIAEMDESEVLAEFYQKDEEAHFQKILDYLASHFPEMPQTQTNPHREANFNPKMRKVDIQEYRKASDGTLLYTVGVATCSALTVYSPGRFGVLAHISPTDAAYGISWPTRLALGRHHTDLVNEVVSEVLWFDVHPREKSQLKFGLLGLETESLRNMVSSLLSRGISLNQIHRLVLVVHQVSGLN